MSVIFLVQLFKREEVFKYSQDVVAIKPSTNCLKVDTIVLFESNGPPAKKSQVWSIDTSVNIPLCPHGALRVGFGGLHWELDTAVVLFPVIQVTSQQKASKCFAQAKGQQYMLIVCVHKHSAPVFIIRLYHQVSYRSISLGRYQVKAVICYSWPRHQLTSWCQVSVYI